MDFGFEIIMGFAMNIDKLDLVNLLGLVMDKIVELQIFLTLRKLFQNYEQYGFGLKKKLDFAMDIDNFFGKVMNKIMEYPRYFAKVHRKIRAWNLWQIMKSLLHRKSGNLSQKPYFKAKIAKSPKP